MRRFGTQGPVYPEKNYVVSRSVELDDFIDRVKDGRYIVIFAPRQTGKTTFFQHALDKIADSEPTCLPIQLNFEEFEGSISSTFYNYFFQDLCDEIVNVFNKLSFFSECVNVVIIEEYTPFYKNA